LRIAQARLADAAWLERLLAWTEVAIKPDSEVKSALEVWVPEYQPQQSAPLTSVTRENER